MLCATNWLSLHHMSATRGRRTAVKMLQDGIQAKGINRCHNMPQSRGMSRIANCSFATLVFVNSNRDREQLDI